ncbi:MAG: hypothetical protein V5A51_12875, partial [Bacteroidales bacterium]
REITNHKKQITNNIQISIIKIQNFQAYGHTDFSLECLGHLKLVIGICLISVSGRTSFGACNLEFKIFKLILQCSTTSS